MGRRNAWMSGWMNECMHVHYPFSPFLFSLMLSSFFLPFPSPSSSSSHFSSCSRNLFYLFSWIESKAVFICANEWLWIPSSSSNAYICFCGGMLWERKGGNLVSWLKSYIIYSHIGLLPHCVKGKHSLAVRKVFFALYTHWYCKCGSTRSDS